MTTHVSARFLTLGSLAAALALALTACQGEGGVRTSGAADTSAALASASTHSTQLTANGRKTAACSAGSLRFVLESVPRPINHVVLEATNTGKAPCDLYLYPRLTFSDHQSAPTQVVEESKPRSVVTLAPGATGYAGIRTSSGDGSSSKSGETIARLAVRLQDASGRPGGRANIAAPGGRLYVEATGAAVTYWQSSLDNAIEW